MALIRPAVPGDVDAITRIHIAAWRTTYRGLMPDGLLDNLSYEGRRSWWQGVIDRKLDVIVAEQDGQAVGFAHFGPDRENDPIYHGELYAIYLLEDYQHKSLGSLLVKATAQGLLRQDVDTMLVWVLSTNPARHFYEKLGGILLREKPIEIGGVILQESAYGWRDIRPLTEIG